MSNTLNILSESTFAEKMDTQNLLLAAIASQSGGISIASWADVQNVVRLGLAAKLFPIGSQLVCEKNSASLTWDVIGVDQDTPSDSQFTHSLTLQLHDCYASLQFDAKEAFYYAEEGLPAGTYNFLVGAQPWMSSDVGKNYQFTIENDIPEGGQIVFNNNYNVSFDGATVSVYESGIATTATESVTMTEGADGEFLGTINSAVNGNINSVHRALLGSNNWGDSAMRQWLNSDAAGGSWWTPKTVFCRPSGNASTAGFLNGLDTEFLSCIGKVKKVTALNTISDGGGSEESDELFFLLSRSEVYSGKENGIDEGDAYNYYADYSELTAAGTGNDANRIKYRNGSAQYWWLRSPYSGDASTVRGVNPTGNVYDSSAVSSSGVAPACCIV